MPTYLLTIAYQGTRYGGWQRQANRDTVQQRVESAAVVCRVDAQRRQLDAVVSRRIHRSPPTRVGWCGKFGWID